MGLVWHELAFQQTNKGSRTCPLRAAAMGLGASALIARSTGATR